MKMKTKRLIRRFLPVAIAVAVLTALFCVPVSASSGWQTLEMTSDECLVTHSGAYIYNQYGVTDYTLYAFPSQSGNIFNEMGYFSVVAKKGEACALRIPVKFPAVSLEAGDLFTATFKDFGIGIYPLEFGTFTRITLAFSEDGEMYTYDVDEQLSYNNGGSYLYDSFTVEHIVHKDSEVSLRYIFIRFVYGGDQGSSDYISYNPMGGVSFGYGNPNSAESPNYSPPDDGGALDEYENAENELNDATSEGKDAADNIFTNFAADVLSFAGGLLAVTKILELFLGIPQIGGLITVSLAIGFVGFVFGISQIGKPAAEMFGNSSGGMTNADGTKTRSPDWDEKWLM